MKKYLNRDNSLIFQKWLNSPSGQVILSTEYQALAPYYRAFHCEIAILLGMGIYIKILNNVNARYKIIINNHNTFMKNKIKALAEYHSLPLPNKLIDLIYLPHCLELNAHPHQILKEACRVLSPEGNLVITGINLWSIQGLTLQFKQKLFKKSTWHGNFISLQRLKDWLLFLNFDEIDIETHYTFPTMISENWRIKLNWILSIIKFILPLSGGVYIIKAKKRCVPITPMRVIFKPIDLDSIDNLGACTLNV